SIEHKEPLSRQLKSWLKGMAKVIRDRLVKIVGLEHLEGVSEATQAPRMSLKAFSEFVVTNYYQRRENTADDRSGYVAESTRNNMILTCKAVVEHFGDVPLKSINTGQIDLWKNELMTTKKKATVAGYLKKFKRLMSLAKRHKHIDQNPFIDDEGKLQIKIPSQINEDRKCYVPPDQVQQLLDVCTTSLKAVVVLSRYCGLRVPSEVSKLKWSDIDWHKRTLKANRQKNKRVSIQPLLPIVFDHLKELWEASLSREEFIFSNYAKNPDEAKAIGQTLRRILKANNQEVWPKITNNLRASLSTDLKNQGLPNKAVNAWLDHSETVASDHYDLITTAEFNKAISLDVNTFQQF
ncbi:MAG: tyrosine-type recombinase/integrase, partial [Pirellulales bacterium]